jgi:signal transduction histidine kinase
VDRVDDAVGRDWEQLSGRLMIFVPWVLLPLSAVLSQLAAGLSRADRAGTLALVAVAAGWVYVGHTRVPPDRWQRPAYGLAYFAGLLALFAALMTRDLIFVLFTITGFFHAYQLRPWPLGVAGVLGTSVTLNTATMGVPDATPAALGAYLGVIGIQTAAIGAGILFGDKVHEQHQRRAETVRRLEAALAENAGLHAQLLTQAREAGVLDERQRMAREIHDTLAQGLAGIVTQVQAARQVWHAPDEARPYVDRALALARDGLAEARRSVEALRPRELEDARLPDALGDLARRWADAVGITPSVEVTGDPVPLSPALEVALFRVAQEALTNVAKHARATRVGLTLSYLDDTVLLDVRDDGEGFGGGTGEGIGERTGDGEGFVGGFGLIGMRQRIRSVGGTVEFESAPGEGTAVSVSVPAILPAAAAPVTP